MGWSSGTVLETLSEKYKSVDHKQSLNEQWMIAVFISLSRFESCWPAIMKDSCGVVIVFNPDVKSHLKEIETWHSMFISSQSLQESQCLLIAHQKPGSDAENGRLPLGTRTAGLLEAFCWKRTRTNAVILVVQPRT